MTSREAFEAFISAPPFEMPIERFDDRCAWPGSYTELEVDLAWQAWKASHDAALERAAVACESLGMTTSGIYERNHECASAIRALKESKE